jgi:hypothetical protein
MRGMPPATARSAMSPSVRRPSWSGGHPRLWATLHEPPVARVLVGRPRGQCGSVGVVMLVLVAVGDHGAPAVPAAPADDVEGRRVEGVGRADHRADVEVVAPVFDGHVERDAAGCRGRRRSPRAANSGSDQRRCGGHPLRAAPDPSGRREAAGRHTDRRRCRLRRRCCLRRLRQDRHRWPQRWCCRLGAFDPRHRASGPRAHPNGPTRPRSVGSVRPPDVREGLGIHPSNPRPLPSRYANLHYVHYC